MRAAAPSSAPSSEEKRITERVRRELFPGAPAETWRLWAESMLGTNPATRAASDADLRRAIQQQQLQERARLSALVLRQRQALETIEERLHCGEDVADVFAELLHGEEVSDG